MPRSFIYSIVDRCFRYDILFCPNITDFKVGSFPSALHCTINSKALSVSWFLDRFIIERPIKNGYSFIKPSSVTLFLPNFNIEIR